MSDRLIPLNAILEKLPESGWEHGDFEVNWIVANPHALIRPIEVGGKLNLWHLDLAEADLEAEPTRAVELFEPILAAKASMRICSVG